MRTADAERARELSEPCFASLLVEWKYLGSVKENDIRVLEYGVTLADTVTPGVVGDDLGSLPDSPLRGFSSAELPRSRSAARGGRRGSAAAYQASSS